MRTLRLTAKDFKQSSDYWKDYIGKEDVSDFDGHIQIEGGLGYCKFVSIKVSGHLSAEAGSGIKAGWGIEAGSGIKAGYGIEAGSGIKAGWGIEAGSGIKAGWGIEAGSGIKAGWGIEAGDGIEAGWGIEAGYGIVSLFSWIKAKLKIKIDARCVIVAGCFTYEGPQDVEAQEIKGKVAYGNVKLLPKENDKKQEPIKKAKKLKVKADELLYQANKM